MKERDVPAWQRSSFETILIDPELVRPTAIVAAMLGAGHAAVARVAAGAVWEDESRIAFPREAGAHAGRMSLLWQRAARHLEHRQAELRR